MQFNELVKRRRSVRQFKPNAVDSGILERVLEAGMWAPSAGNLQPWRFIVVQDKKIKERLAKIHTEFSHRTWSRFSPEVARDLAGRGGTWKKEYLIDVPVWIIVCFELTLQEDWDETAFASTWCAVENMLLAATFEGLGSCPYTLADGEEQAIRDVLSIPKDHRIAAIVHLGYTDAETKAPKRKEFESLVGLDAFP